TFALDPVSEDNTDTNDTGSVGWTFTLDDSNPILQSLAVNQTITQVYTVTLSDGHGGTVTQDVTVTVTGTNDAPVVNAIATTPLTEQTDTSALKGTIGVTFTDVDLTDTGHSAAITHAVATGVTTGLA